MRRGSCVATTHLRCALYAAAEVTHNVDTQENLIVSGCEDDCVAIHHRGSCDQRHTCNTRSSRATCRMRLRRQSRDIATQKTHIARRCGHVSWSMLLSSSFLPMLRLYLYISRLHRSLSAPSVDTDRYPELPSRTWSRLPSFHRPRSLPRPPRLRPPPSPRRQQRLPAKPATPAIGRMPPFPAVGRQSRGRTPARRYHCRTLYSRAHPSAP